MHNTSNCDKLIKIAEKKLYDTKDKQRRSILQNIHKGALHEVASLLDVSEHTVNVWEDSTLTHPYCMGYIGATFNQGLQVKVSISTHLGFMQFKDSVQFFFLLAPYTALRIHEGKCANSYSYHISILSTPLRLVREIDRRRMEYESVIKEHRRTQYGPPYRQMALGIVGNLFAK